KVYELYARHVGGSSLWGFTEVGELVFDLHEGVVVDPTEERLRDEFGNTKVLHLPMQSIIRVEEVERKGQSAIRDAATGEKVVTPFPLPAKPRGARPAGPIPARRGRGCDAGQFLQLRQRGGDRRIARQRRARLVFVAFLVAAQVARQCRLGDRADGGGRH